MSTEAFALIVQPADLPTGLFVPIVSVNSVLQDGEGFSDVTAVLHGDAMLQISQGARVILQVILAPEVAAQRLALLRLPLDEDDQPDYGVTPVRHTVQVIG